MRRREEEEGEKKERRGREGNRKERGGREEGLSYESWYFMIGNKTSD